MGRAKQNLGARTGKQNPAGLFFYFSYYYFTTVCPVAGEV